MARNRLPWGACRRIHSPASRPLVIPPLPAMVTLAEGWLRAQAGITRLTAVAAASTPVLWEWERAGQGPAGQGGQHRGYRQQVLEALDWPEGEEQHRDDHPGEQQALTPGSLTAKPDEPSEGGGQDSRADPAGQNGEIEPCAVIRPPEQLPYEV